MAFFGVTRYTGDEDKRDTKSDADNILQKLHEAAELRRHSKKFESGTDDSPKEKASPKKRKCDTESEASSSKLDHGLSEENEEEISQKKQKIRKKEKKTQEKQEKVQEKLNKNEIPKEELHPELLTDEDELKIPSEENQEDEDVGFVHDEATGEESFTVLGEVQAKKLQKVHRVLPDWLDKPTVITDDLRNKCTSFDEVKGLDPDLKEKLHENGIKDFFPVQGVLLPELLRSFQYGYLCGDAGFRPPDICCSAPTGSGKTLVYVLPIIQVLSHRVVPQVRALVVLPVRDLVKQVYNIFQTYCKGTNLKVVQLTGFKTFSSEQKLLVRNGPCGFESQCDILISTPGRLVSHISSTPGFTLKHLRFMVIDEADRMMDEVKHDWLRHVEDALYSKSNTHGSAAEPHHIYGDIWRHPPPPMTPSSACKPQLVLQKLLFSATLSQNPEKLQLLNLFQPKLFTSVVQEVHKTDTPVTESKKAMEGEFIGKFTTPRGLTELFIQSKPAEKPLVMIRLIQHLKYRHVLCFTNSTETAHRLYWLIKLTCDVQVREISSWQHTDKRNRILKQFANGKVNVLVSTDALARGMDIDNVRFVISYESPPYLKTYIHRAGRTARAGKVGTAITLLDKKEIFHFKQMLKEAGKTQVKEMKVKISELKPFVPLYTKALEQLQQVLKAEAQK